MKKILTLLILLSLLALPLLFSGCNKEKGDSIRFLNFKPEIAEKYKELAEIYYKETGVRVIVDTAASGTYEQTLASKMSTGERPVIFQVNGPRGYENWKDYCADLSGTELYRVLSDKSLALRDENVVVGIPYVVEGYGIIYNKALTDKYFALADRQKNVNSMVEIKDFDTLRIVVEDMTRKKGELGIDGVFATTSLKSGEDWRWTTHLFNIPLSYEFEDRELDLGSDEALRSILFSHEGEMRNIFDLYINNSVSDKGMLGTKTVSDSMAEFALEKCVMVQNGNWAWAQIADVDGNRVKAENVAFLPIYTGAKGEEERGLAIGTENYICINKKADEKEQKLAADFLYWLFSSETGKKYVTDYFGFISPFSTFEEDELPKDPLAKEVIRYTKMENIRSVPWNFTLFPSQTFKDALGASLLRYAQGAKDWSAVVSDTVKKWESEMKQ